MAGDGKGLILKLAIWVQHLPSVYEAAAGHVGDQAALACASRIEIRGLIV